MNIVVAFGCLMAVAVTAKANSLQGQQREIEDQIETESRLEIQTRYRACRKLDGACINKNIDCPSMLPLSKRPGRPWCNKRRKCCYPGPTSSATLIGCVLNDKTYPDNTINNDTCMIMQCDNGVWRFTGRNNTECGTCYLEGDPHIQTYDVHHLINGPNPIKIYEDSNTGEMVLSQPGLEVPALFGVNADFKTCINKSDVSCVSRLFYYEPGIMVEIVLPEELYGDYCFYDISDPQDDPKCTTKILVNNEIRIFEENGDVSSFSGTDGTVLISESCDWNVGPNEVVCQINVVGSKGISVELQVVPGDNIKGYNLYINALSSLQNQLFGLCDIFTGSVVSNYTRQDGGAITDFDDISLFTASWKVGVGVGAEI